MTTSNPGAAHSERRGPNPGDTVQVEEASLQNSVLGAVVARNDAHATRRSSVAPVAGPDAQRTSGAGTVFVAGHDADIRNSGVGVVVARNDARLERSLVILLAVGRAVAGDGVRVLMTLPLAVAFGAAFGVALALIRFWLRRPMTDAG